MRRAAKGVYVEVLVNALEALHSALRSFDLEIFLGHR